jgi:hypothetical protein
VISSPPGFFEDVSRHSFGVAWDKRMSRYTVGGQSFKYSELAGWDWNQLVWLLNAAIGDDQLICVCWAFENMLIRCQGELVRPWQAAMQVLSQHVETRALPAIEYLLKYVPDLEVLKAIDHNSWSSYLLGKTFSDQAAKRASKSDLQSKKKLALHFLGNSRTRLEWERSQPSADPYRTAAIAAALGVAVAAAYESAAYLQWKGTRTTALAE